MTEIKLYKTNWKGLKLIGLAIPFVAVGIFAIRTEQFGTFDNFMGWVATFFFGLGIPIGIFQVFDKRPQIIINENGIWDRTSKQEEIKWEQIKKAYQINISGQKFISISTDDSFVFKTKQYKWAISLSKAVGAQKLNLHLNQINIDEKKLTEFINEICKIDKPYRANLIRLYFEK
ncbi:STM3941 family protein [Lacihabitans soyangensis]|uniref:Uncharacterized protein n=1 Tax=Lacihabitans soyangensis TaxID=869394 RepID=A0AAE3KXK6_9BACT|nr:STM3941 family protein [Lacihabitans soyangensis]MCP9765280.1 hypothetical protein [Lacihabitans soyangensis]